MELPVCNQVVSLGTWCATALWMKRKGLKAASYPFDWIVSRPHLVQRCIEDGFQTFLDRSKVQDKRNRDLPGMHYYHLKGGTFTDEEHKYYQRCVKRFLELPPKTTFVICTLDDCTALVETLRKHFQDPHLVILRQYKTWDKKLHSHREWHRVSTWVTEYRTWIWYQEFSWEQKELWFLWEVVMWEIRKSYKPVEPAIGKAKCEKPTLDIEWMR